MMRGRGLAVAAALVAAGLLVAVVAWFLQDSSLERARVRGLVVGYAIEPPYAYLDEQGQVTGESPEVAREIARRLGISDLRWVKSEFGQLLYELQASNIDLIAAGMFITPEREELASFSVPTLQVRQGLLVPRGNPNDLHAYEDAVARENLSIAVLTGSIEEKLLHDLGMPLERLVRVPDAKTGYSGVVAGVAAGLALSMPTLFWMLKEHGEERTEIASPFRQPPLPPHTLPGRVGVAFRPSDPTLRAAWNDALKGFLGSPEHIALISKFGFQREDIPARLELNP
jgi:polar amino acid transport system substrate-binding protein